MSATAVKQLPLSELYGWFAFYSEKDRRDRAANGDLCAMDDPLEGLKGLGLVE